VKIFWGAEYPGLACWRTLALKVRVQGICAPEIHARNLMAAIDEGGAAAGRLPLQSWKAMA